MTAPRSLARLLSLAAGGGVLAAIVVVFLIPYAWIVTSAFKPHAVIFRDVNPISIWTFLPANPTIDNFVRLFLDRGLGRALMNSAIISSGRKRSGWRLHSSGLLRHPFSKRRPKPPASESPNIEQFLRLKSLLMKSSEGKCCARQQTICVLPDGYANQPRDFGAP